MGLKEDNQRLRQACIEQGEWFNWLMARNRDLRFLLERWLDCFYDRPDMDQFAPPELIEQTTWALRVLPLSPDTLPHTHETNIAKDSAGDDSHRV